MSVINKKQNIILIVDDNPDNIKLLSKVFKEEGYKIHAAVNGIQAVESVNADPPNIILMDIQMPKMDGYEACRQIKKMKKNQLIPIIFISAMNMQFNKTIAFKAGGVDFIQKPFHIEEIKIRVETHLKLYEYQKELEETNINLLKMFKSTFELSAVGIAFVDPENSNFFKINSHFCSIFNYSENELLKKNIFELIDIEFRDKIKDEINKLKINESKSFTSELLCIKKDSKKIWIKITVTSIKKTSREPDYFVFIAEDISINKEYEKLIITKSQKIEQSLKEKDILIKELYHRTKNNMQVIASLIKLKSKTFNNKKIQFFCDEIENKIHSMSLVHKLLYKSKNLSHISLKTYIKELIQIILPINKNGSQIIIEKSVSNIQIILDIAIPVGLIINELVINSFQHAFPAKNKGKINLKIYISKNILNIEYKDNGVGMKSSFDWNNIQTLGLLTVKALAENQLHGTILFNNSANGVSFHIKFNPDVYQPRI